MLKQKALSIIIPVLTGTAILAVGITAAKIKNSNTDSSSENNGSILSSLETTTVSAVPLPETSPASKAQSLTLFLLKKTNYGTGLDINGDNRINITDLIIYKRNRLQQKNLQTTITTSSITTQTAPITSVPFISTQTAPPVTTTIPNTSTPTTIQTVPVTTSPPIIDTQPEPTNPPVTVIPDPSDLSEYQSEVLRLVNIERSNAGLSPLLSDATLMQAAQTRAGEIIQSFSHTRPSGASCFTILSELGISYRSCGENIAAGYDTPAKTVEQWMNSEGHRANILNPNFTHLGVGYASQPGSTYRYYWTQIFIGN